MKSEEFVIIVAGGKGLRMGSDIPKQFLPIGGKPVLMRTLERFRAYSEDLQIILVLPQVQQDYWQQLCREYHFDIQYQLTDGGETRFHSVQHGLALVPDDAEGVVGVHDGVRPFPSIEVIRNCYEAAREKKAVIPVIPVVETLRHISLTSHLSPLTTKEYNEAVKQAAYDAGKRRMVPIFLTTATTGVGVVPMILAQSSFWMPVGVTIFAGGIGSLIMVVMMLPVIYWKVSTK